jgi:tetratricopeptide (TPR) repeat protein
MPGDRCRILALALILVPVTGLCQSSPPASSSESEQLLSTVKSLYAAADWNGVLRAIPPSEHHSAELDFYRGMSLARLQRWQEARETFERGQKKAPEDARFLNELAGVCFKLQNYKDTKSALRQALERNESDHYTNDFLATVYLLEGNLEGALKYWNRVDKPRIAQVKMEPQPRLRPVILDKAFALAPESVLGLEEYRTTRARLDLLEIYPRHRFELQPRPGLQFDLLFNPAEKNGWAKTKWEKLYALFRGAPSLSLRFDLWNLGRSAANLETHFRFDRQKLRAFAEFSKPLRGDPGWRYRIYADSRRENWDLTRSYQGGSPLLGDMRVQRLVAGAEIRNQINWRWNWKSGIEVSYRDFRTPPPVSPASETLFTEGLSLKYMAGLERKLLRIPERRFVIDSFADFQVGKLFRGDSERFLKLQAGLRSEWLPRAAGDDYALLTQFRAGTTDGDLPFDELFILGLERDNNLWMRGHVATQNRKRGSGVLGHKYLLFNSELDKQIFQRSSFVVSLGPSLDIGRAYDRSHDFGSNRWLWDVGILLKARLGNSITVIWSYGKDLRTGRDEFYLSSRSPGGSRSFF